MKSRVLPFIVSVLASTIAVGAQAQSFQFQTDADYNSTDTGPADLNGMQIRQQYFLSPIQNGDNQPWREAAFLSRSSSANLTYNRVEVDGGNYDGSLNSWGVGGEYMSNSHDFYAALDVNFLNGDNSYAAIGKMGFFVQQNWLVALDVYHANPDNESSSTDYGLSTKVVLPVMAGDHLVLSASVADFEYRNGHMVAADYYIRPYWSVGLAMHENMASLTNWFDDRLEVRTEYFVTPQLALRGSVAQVEEGSANDTQFAVGASYRF